MLSFTEAAERLVADGIAQSMTAEGLRKLARDPASGWPIAPGDYRVVGKTRMLPYEVLVPYMQARRRGRGPDKVGQRAPALKQPDGPASARAATEGETMPVAPDPLPEMFGGLSRLLASSSRDWGADAEDAWIYGLFCGWGCEDDHEHDDVCGGDAAMKEMAGAHGWDAETVARLRRYRAAVQASTGEPFTRGASREGRGG